MPQSRNKDFLLVAAFDIGPTHCGIAYSFSHEPGKILICPWYTTGKSLKTRTRVLLDPCGHFHTFGYEATDHFLHLTEDGSTSGWRLFSNLHIHHPEQASNNPEDLYVEDYKGKDYPAVKLYAMAIQYLYERLLCLVDESPWDRNFVRDYTQYIITIPGVLDFGARTLMINAAVEAGLDADRLDIVFEHDAVAKWYSRADGPCPDINSRGSTFMLIDFGASSTQIAVFKKVENQVKMLHQARFMGWTHFENKIIEYLETVFGKEQIDELRTQNAYDEMKSDFESKVKNYRHKDEDYIRVCTGRPLRLNLINTGIKLKNNRLYIHFTELDPWFEQFMGQLIKCIKEICSREKTKDTRTIMLVGRLAENTYIRDRLRAEFSGLRIIADNPETIVLSSAVHFGHELKGKHDYSDITPRVVAAFDFGTTYSGYAYSYTDDSTKIYISKSFISGGSSSNISSKAPTSVLLDETGKFHLFGFEAEDKFARLAEEGKSEKWKLFRRFKMTLHANKTLARNTIITDIHNDPYLAMDIYAMAIRYLHGHLLKALAISSPNIFESEIQYVITVPAIWDLGAKQFMREAAIKAGIDEGQLKIALESEVAALWCKQLTQKTRIDNQASLAKYIVIDLGGGTADVSVFQRSKSDGIEMLHKASGGPWGGTCVDEQYFQYLESKLGVGVLDELRSKNIDDYFEIIRDFEGKKRLQSGEMLTVKLPTSLREIVQKRNPTAQPIQEKLRIDQVLVDAWFEQPITRLIYHVKKLICDNNINEHGNIFLVGGFAESQLVQDRIKKELPDFSLIVPEEADLAVLRGAVLFGYNPNTVTFRVMPYTYGISQFHIFDLKKHPPQRKSERLVENGFTVFVRVNERIPVDHKIVHLAYPRSHISTIPVYRTLDANPVFTTDARCEKVGELKIKNSTRVHLKDQTIKVTFMFGQTELIVKVHHERTKEKETLTIDCFKWQTSE